jgi:uncharacterized protein YkwD
VVATDAGRYTPAFVRGSSTRTLGSQRRLRIAVILSLLAGLLAPSASTAAIQKDVSLGRTVVAKINALRGSHKLPRLRTSARLARAALGHAVSMGHLGYFSHASADGSSAIRRIEAYYDGKGAGEVMYWAEGNGSPAQAIAWWLGSGSHRAQLLSTRFKEIGVGAVHVNDAPGFFGGRDVTIVVVDLGRPR